MRAREAAWRAAAGPRAGPVAWGRAPLALLRDEERPTAVMCASDTLAFSVVAAARSLGRDVPRDVSVTGFDDSPLAALATPGLTSVRVDYREFGAAAAGLLLAAIGAGEAPDYSPSPPALVVRGSTGRRR
jgi:DNA-binding LacI/PurR family transcriptional regulator